MSRIKPRNDSDKLRLQYMKNKKTNMDTQANTKPEPTEGHSDKGSLYGIPLLFCWLGRKHSAILISPTHDHGRNAIMDSRSCILSTSSALQKDFSLQPGPRRHQCPGASSPGSATSAKSKFSPSPAVGPAIPRNTHHLHCAPKPYSKGPYSFDVAWPGWWPRIFT